MWVLSRGTQGQTPRERVGRGDGTGSHVITVILGVGRRDSQRDKSRETGMAQWGGSIPTKNTSKQDALPPYR